LFAAHGTSYGAELLRVRLELAARLLHQPQFGDLPVTEIAWRAGFADPSHFYRRFRERFGMPPGVFRSGAADAADGTYRNKRFTLS
jgi:AraC-like DNA-binding protein